MADPIALLGLGGDDWTTLAAVTQRARAIHVERRAEELNGLAKAIGAQVGNAVAQMFS